jgi:hypothetical protein
VGGRSSVLEWSSGGCGEGSTNETGQPGWASHQFGKSAEFGCIVRSRSGCGCVHLAGRYSYPLYCTGVGGGSVYSFRG